MSEILLKPINTEKAVQQNEKQNIYTFKVVKNANKIEIKKAVERLFGVNVEAVKTIVVPKKTKNRFTQKGSVTSVTPSYKKALVQIKFDQTIDYYKLD